MLTSRLRVIHCLPSAIRLEGYVAALRDANAMLNAMDTTQTRTGLVLLASGATAIC